MIDSSYWLFAQNNNVSNGSRVHSLKARKIGRMQRFNHWMPVTRSRAIWEIHFEKAIWKRTKERIGARAKKKEDKRSWIKQKGWEKKIMGMTPCAARDGIKMVFDDTHKLNWRLPSKIFPSVCAKLAWLRPLGITISDGVVLCISLFFLFLLLFVVFANKKKRISESRPP